MSAPTTLLALQKIFLAQTGASTHIHDDDIAGRQFGDENLANIGSVAVHRPIQQLGAALPPSRKSAVNVVVFQ